MVVHKNPKGLDTKLFSFPKGLTLTELEATTSLGLTWLLTLNLTAITCQETCVLQLLLVLFIDLHQSACDSETECLALASETTTIEVHLDIVLLSYFEQVQRLLNHILQDS